MGIDDELLVILTKVKRWYQTLFDQGSAATITKEDGNTRITPVQHWDSKWAWWAVRWNALSGQTPTYLIAKANHFNLAAGERLAVWAQAADTDTWNDFTTVTIGATDLEITHGSAFPSGMIYIAALPMYPFSRVQRKVSEWLANALVSDTASSTAG
jgi:hypothetical protein